MAFERIEPSADPWRMVAMLLADIRNGPVQRRDGRLWSASDFLPSSFQVAPAKQSQEEIRAILGLMQTQMESFRRARRS